MAETSGPNRSPSRRLVDALDNAAMAFTLVAHLVGSILFVILMLANVNNGPGFQFDRALGGVVLVTVPIALPAGLWVGWSAWRQPEPPLPPEEPGVMFGPHALAALALVIAASTGLRWTEAALVAWLVLCCSMVILCVYWMIVEAID